MNRGTREFFLKPVARSYGENGGDPGAGSGLAARCLQERKGRMSGTGIGALVVLAAVLLCGAARSQERNEEVELDVELGEPVVVAQAEAARHPWGVWQFPTITRLAPDLLEVSFSQSVDSASLDSAKKFNQPGVRVSSDDGKTWRGSEKRYGSRGACLLQNGDLITVAGPPSVDVPKADLPDPSVREHGYNGVYMIRDPLQMPATLGQYYLQRKPAGSREWERLPATIDDPNGGVTCYDPPHSDHAVVRWRSLQQIVQMPDDSLLGVSYGFLLGQDRHARPKFESYCLRSADGGQTWTFHGIIARDDRHPLAGYTEPRVTVLCDGSLLAVIRTECAKTGPMYVTRSTDQGKTWDKPEELWPFGVLPQLLTLENGVTVLAFGRPGVHLLFSKDGKGREWQHPIHLVVESFEGTGIRGEGYGYQKGEQPQGRPKQTRTSGYTSLVPDGPDRFLIAYDQFDYPNADGEPRKTILVRPIRVLLKEPTNDEGTKPCTSTNRVASSEPS